MQGHAYILIPASAALQIMVTAGGGETVGLSQGQSRLAQVQESMGKYQISSSGEITVNEIK